jgi:hypothetical protein
MSRKILSLADKADAALFAAAEALARLAEATEDFAVAMAAREVRGARRLARSHMTEEQRRKTPY